MKKTLLGLSLATSLVLMSGCGGSSSSPAEPTDTTAPTITNATSEYTVVEGATQTVTLTASETVSYSDDSAETTISGSTLTFTAPAYSSEGGNTYTVTVTATDTADLTGTKTFTFTVTEDVTYAADASVVVPTSGQTFTTVDPNGVVDATGLLWQDASSAAMTYTAAVDYCSNAGYRLPSRNELMNILDYSAGSAVTDTPLIYSDYFDVTAQSLWVAQEGSTYYTVNTISGGDSVVADPTIERSVLCVSGTAAGAHTIAVSDTNSSIYVDSTTGYEWTVIDSTNYISTYGAYADAAGLCPTGFALPTINDLRSIYDFANNKLFGIAPGTVTADTYTIWSSTQVTNTADSQHHVIFNDRAASTITRAISSDTDDQTHYVTCVKK